MVWIESHQPLRNHPKLFSLMESLKITRRDAIGLLHLLWWWCADYAKDGQLDKVSLTHLCRELDWTGDKDQLLDALVECGFVDRNPLRIHDWPEYRLHFEAMAERVERKRDGARRRAKDYRERKALRHAPEKRDVMQSNADTRPEQPEQNNQLRVRKTFSKPTAEEVATYAKSIEFALNGSEFVDYYESKGWLIGKSPMRDWKATVRNWKRNPIARPSASGTPSWM